MPLGGIDRVAWFEQGSVQRREEMHASWCFKRSLWQSDAFAGQRYRARSILHVDVQRGMNRKKAFKAIVSWFVPASDDTHLAVALIFIYSNDAITPFGSSSASLLATRHNEFLKFHSVTLYKKKVFVDFLNKRSVTASWSYRDLFQNWILTQCVHSSKHKVLKEFV